MSSFLFRFRLNLGLKRLFIDNPAASAVLAQLQPGRLKLPSLTLDEFIGAPAPVIPFRQLATPPITTGPEDLIPLCSLAHSIGARRILEIGCHLGAGTLSLALACPEARIVTYDINLQAGRLIDESAASLRERIERRYVSFPTDEARLRAEAPYDFIYVDGDHTEVGASADTELALDRLAPGGIIAWHDYCHRGNEWVYRTNCVPEVLAALSKRLPVRHIVGSRIAVWRKPIH
ncbi:MAG TPA: class I SAM-dependent methyltransferase [Opitutaceae bacterium]